MTEAQVNSTAHGDQPQGDGWFILNAQQAAWKENASFGKWLSFENDVRFPSIGLNIHVLQPGQAACKYHREDAQEDFLVLSGECLLLVNEQERPMKQWDLFHCPAGVDHVFIGAGPGPCAILMIGERKADCEITYPVSPLAKQYGASVETETNNPREAYAEIPASSPIRSPWPLS